MSSEDFTDKQNDILTGLNVSGAVLSIIGCCFIIGTYLRYQKLQKLSFKLIFFVAIADFVTSFGKCFGSPSTGTFLCGLQGFLTTFGDLASIFWVFIISAVMYGILFHSQVWMNTIETDTIYFGDKSIKLLYVHIIIWAFSLILALLPFTLENGNGYSNTGGKCWISHNGHSQIFSWICFYIWLWIIFIIIAILYFKIYRTMSKINNNNDNKSGMKTANRIRWYPLVLFICYFFATLRRIWNFSGTDSPFWIVCLRVFFAAMYGFGNAIVYGYTIYVILSDLHIVNASKPEINHKTTQSTEKLHKQVDENTVDMSAGNDIR